MSCDIGEVAERLENELCSHTHTEVKGQEGWRMSSAHSPTFLSLHLHHNSFSNPSVALPMSQLILQPFCCFSYVTVRSQTLLLLLLHHKLFSYVTWRAAHVFNFECHVFSTDDKGREIFYVFKVTTINSYTALVPLNCWTNYSCHCAHGCAWCCNGFS